MNSRCLKRTWLLVILVLVTCVWCANAAAFEPLAGDMSTFDPDNQTFPPLSDDVIKVGVYWPFSGPSAVNGYTYWLSIGWAVHDINSQGGVMVDGKRKKIVMIKGDHQMEPSAAKKAIEKLCTQDKVDFIIGTTGTHLCLIGQSVAARYKKVYLNVSALSDMLMDAKHFNRYTFRACTTNTMFAKTLAQFYAYRPEKKFYLLCQDYAYGHEFAQAFETALGTNKPDAIIVGKDFHPLFHKDFAPYLSKISGAGAEVIITPDYSPDMDNLIKQADQLGMKTPLAGPFGISILAFASIKPPHGRGNIYANFIFDPANPENMKFMNAWNTQWKTWGGQLFGNVAYSWPGGTMSQGTIATYWMFKVVEKAGSLDSEKIIAAWEGDQQTLLGNSYTMRACDHQALFDMQVSELSWPCQWYEKSAGPTEVDTIPASRVAQPIPTGLKRCK